MIQNPVYKDTTYTFNSADIRFRILLGGDTIYEGRAKAKPDESYASININKICMNYLNNTLENQNLTATTAFTVTHSEAYREFILTAYNVQTGSWDTLETFAFLYDYDYETPIDFSASVRLSSPINGHNNNGMLLPSTFYYTNGSVRTGFITFNGASKYCGRYSLLYKNRKGGWDNFLFEGKCKKEDYYSISKMKKAFNNTTNEFGEIRYLNEVKDRWELNTGYLSDMESEEFAKNLVCSNECYLQDLVEGRIIPVTIMDTSVKYKKYLVDDENPIFYTITVESSQEKIII